MSLKGPLAQGAAFARRRRPAIRSATPISSRATASTIHILTLDPVKAVPPRPGGDDNPTFVVRRRELRPARPEPQQHEEADADGTRSPSFLIIERPLSPGLTASSLPNAVCLHPKSGLLDHSTPSSPTRRFGEGPRRGEPEGSTRAPTRRTTAPGGWTIRPPTSSLGGGSSEPAKAGTASRTTRLTADRTKSPSFLIIERPFRLVSCRTAYGNGRLVASPEQMFLNHSRLAWPNRWFGEGLRRGEPEGSTRARPSHERYPDIGPRDRRSGVP